MTSSNKDFLNQIDELLSLFNQLQAKAKKEGLIKDDDSMIKNLEFLSSNYAMFKKSMPEDMVSEIAGPIKDIVSEIIEHLKNEMGETFKEKDNSIISDLEQIDDLLQKDGISEQEINDLLDKRAKIK